VAPEHDQRGGAAEVRFGSGLRSLAWARVWQFERAQLIERHELPIVNHGVPSGGRTREYLLSMALPLLHLGHANHGYDHR
jgi:hypothetical protein